MKLIIDATPIHWPYATMFPNSLELDKNLYLIKGENGIGKSQWLKHFLSQSSAIAANFSFCFQDKLLPFNAVNLRELKKNWHSVFHDRFDLQKFDELTSLFQIDFQETPIELLSGGQSQLIKLILCFSLRAQWYFLDEPLQYLSMTNMKKLKEWILSHKNDFGFMIIDHTDEFKMEAFKIIEMSKGQRGIEWN
jgi:ABC-type multidrug transport system ATPase subunit